MRDKFALEIGLAWKAIYRVKQATYSGHEKPYETLMYFGEPSESWQAEAWKEVEFEVNATRAAYVTDAVVGPNVPADGVLGVLAKNMEIYRNALAHARTSGGNSTKLLYVPRSDGDDKREALCEWASAYYDGPTSDECKGMYVLNEHTLLAIIICAQHLDVRNFMYCMGADLKPILQIPMPPFCEKVVQEATERFTNNLMRVQAQVQAQKRWEPVAEPKRISRKLDKPTAQFRPSSYKPSKAQLEEPNGLPPDATLEALARATARLTTMAEAD